MASPSYVVPGLIRPADAAVVDGGGVALGDGRGFGAEGLGSGVGEAVGVGLPVGVG
ncbi:hypothetical protein [Promicromonospora sp. NPDC023805]|uniref:hypothetical protein n=1 Tax=Promicromonospora sp. NPDC023805 TaxID=3154696 RepID=UPI0033F12157